MEKHFFIKKYPLAHGLTGSTEENIHSISIKTEDLEMELTEGAKISSDSIKTAVVGNEFVVHGEYTIKKPGTSSVRTQVYPISGRDNKKY